jgi:metallo-beta-lactamase family protein
MKLKVLGAAGTVTGSSYVLTSQNGQSILIDLGMFQGPKDIDALNYQPYDYDCSRLAGAVLTHAHLDHCGRLPILLSHGFEGKIYMTQATRDLVELSLFDSAKIALKDRKKALYDKELVQRTLDRIRLVEYHKPIQIADFTINFYDAGHLLGAAILVIEDTKNTSGMRKIVFSGDLGNTPEDLLNETERIESADAVVMESTYGDKLHPNLNPADALQEEINTVEGSGGALLIPSFALEKTQELLHMIMHLKKDGKVAEATPVYLDSPMAKKATDIHSRYPELCNAHVQDDLSSGDPFDFPGLKVIMSPEESRAIHEQPGTKVILAGGGMMTGGRILFHAAFYLPQVVNRIFFVGYQGEDTLGRSILQGDKKVTIEKMPVEVLANVNSTQAMSSHADQQQLMDWLGAIKNVKKVFLTHGDNGPRGVLAQRISAELGISDVILPKMNEEISF